MTYNNKVFSFSYNPNLGKLYRYFIGMGTPVLGNINNNAFSTLTDVEYSYFSKDKVILNTEEYHANSNIPFSTPVSMTIFARNGENGPTLFSKFQLRSFKMCIGGILTRDYIPVLDNNGRSALYDKVEGKFYYNQGTGEDFIPGPEVN